jgi:hypothetical protein
VSYVKITSTKRITGRPPFGWSPLTYLQADICAGLRGVRPDTSQTCACKTKHTFICCTSHRNSQELKSHDSNTRKSSCKDRSLISFLNTRRQKKECLWWVIHRWWESLGRLPRRVVSVCVSFLVECVLRVVSVCVSFLVECVLLWFFSPLSHTHGTGEVDQCSYSIYWKSVTIPLLESCVSFLGHPAPDTDFTKVMKR